MTPTIFRPRTFHPTVDITAPNINNNVTLELGLWIHKDSSRVNLASQTSQLSSSHRLPSTHINPSTQISSTQLAQPKRMDLYLSLPRSPSGIPSPYSGPQCNWSRISMLELSGLVAVNKSWHRPMHLRHAGLKSWLDSTSDHYSQQNHGYSSSVHFPFPRKDTDEDGSMSDK